MSSEIKPLKQRSFRCILAELETVLEVVAVYSKVKYKLVIIKLINLTNKYLV